MTWLISVLLICTALQLAPRKFRTSDEHTLVPYVDLHLSALTRNSLRVSHLAVCVGNHIH